LNDDPKRANWGLNQANFNQAVNFGKQNLTRPNLGKHRALATIRAGSLVARALPETATLGLAQFAGPVAGAIADGRRYQVERNLLRVHGPGFRGRRLRQATSATFASYARYWAESLRLPRLRPAEIDARFSNDGYRHIQDALAAGKGAILALPHLGAWEWAGFWLTTVEGLPLTVVVEALDPPEVFEWFVELRQSLGMNVVPLGPNAGSEVLQALKRNEIVALLCDRDITGGGIPIDFFGERTTLPAGPATLALRTGAALLPTAVYYRGWNSMLIPVADHHAKVSPPMKVERQGRLRDDVTRITGELTGHLERLIRIAPEQWHMLQPNWPSDPGWPHGPLPV
jgi:lauroyl/myristoyl acyltransferase